MTLNDHFLKQIVQNFDGKRNNTFIKRALGTTSNRFDTPISNMNSVEYMIL